MCREGSLSRRGRSAKLFWTACPCPPHSQLEAQTPNVGVSGGGAFGRSPGRRVGSGRHEAVAPCPHHVRTQGGDNHVLSRRGSQQHRRSRHLDGGRAAPHWASGRTPPSAVSLTAAMGYDDTGGRTGWPTPARAAQEGRERSRAVPESPNVRPPRPGQSPRVPHSSQGRLAAGPTVPGSGQPAPGTLREQSALVWHAEVLRSSGSPVLSLHL